MPEGITEIIGTDSACPRNSYDSAAHTHIRPLSSEKSKVLRIKAGIVCLHRNTGGRVDDGRLITDVTNAYISVRITKLWPGTILARSSLRIAIIPGSIVLCHIASTGLGLEIVHSPSLLIGTMSFHEADRIFGNILMSIIHKRKK